MNFKQLLADKASEIEQSLTLWVQTERVLRPGQTLRFEITVVTTKPVEGIIHVEADIPTEITTSSSTKDADFSHIPAGKLAIRIEDLELSGRATSALNNAGCANVGAFLKKYEDFPKWRNVGPKTYIEIQKVFEGIEICLPWPFVWRKKGSKTLNELEGAQVQQTSLTAQDWEKILEIEWCDYQKQTIQWFQKNQNKPAVARDVLEEAFGASKLYSFTTINTKFRNKDLHFRLYVASQAKSSLGQTGLVHRDDLICIGKLYA